MADLIDKMGGKTEVKTLFFGEGVEVSKKRRRQSIRPGNYTIEGGASLRNN